MSLKTERSIFNNPKSSNGDQIAGNESKRIDNPGGENSALVRNLEQITGEIKRGQLDARGDTSKLEGADRALMQGVNEMLDALIEPLNVTAEYIDRISKGDIPQKITDEYNGDFNEIKNNINACIDGLGGVLEANVVLQNMAVNDYTRKVEGMYEGVYGDVAKAVDDVRERLLHVTDTAKNIAVGNISDLEDYRKIGRRSDNDELVPSFTLMMESIKNLVDDSLSLSNAAVEGRLDARADADKHQGDYKSVMQGVNDTLDAVIGPLNVTAEYVDRISKGDIPQKITDDYKGDFNEIKNNINACIDGLGGVLETNAVLQNMAVNNLTQKVEGVYEGVYGEVAASVNTVRERIAHVTETLKHIAAGNGEDYDEYMKIGKRSPEDELVPSVIGMFETLKNMIEDSIFLSTSAVEGKLDARSDVKKHKGDFRLVMQGMNDTLDAVIGPLNVTAEYIDRISKGDIPQKITDDYNGDFNEIKNNVNMLIGSMDEVTAVSQEIAAGNLTVEVVERSGQDTLMKSLKKMVKGLTVVATDVQSAAGQVAAGSEEMSSVSEEMAQSANEQAASIEQVSSSMEEMNSSVIQNVDNARETANIADKTAKDARDGGDAVKETVHAMKSIADKIAVIQDIAGQTNMLALNAAIEAARAGDHGKGFAVVASEVRNLAERSGEAAKEINSLSKQSVEIAERAGVLIDEIVPQIQKTAELVQEIHASSSEQAAGIEQVTIAIGQLDGGIQQNSAATEEMAGTAEELSSQASHLQDIASFFKLNVNNMGANINSGFGTERASIKETFMYDKNNRNRIIAGGNGKGNNGNGKWGTDSKSGVEINMSDPDGFDSF